MSFERSQIKRLFFALWPDADTRERLNALLQQFSDRQGCKVDAGNLHVTLAFIGDADIEKQACLSAAAAQVQCAGFSLKLNRLGYFSQARVLWLGCDAEIAGVSVLHKTLNKALSRCDYVPERRRYTPHVTLMRNAKPLPQAIDLKPIEWQVNRFVLVQSVLIETAQYSVLKEYLLHG